VTRWTESPQYDPWENYPSRRTPRNAERFNAREQAVASYAEDLVGGIGLTPQQFGVVGDGTDETAGLQEWLMAAAGGVAYLPAGVYGFQSLAFPSNLELVGAGWNAVLKVVSAGTYPLYIGAGIHDVRVRGLQIDGNKANMAGDPDVQGDPRCALIAQGTSGSPCQRIFVEDVYLHDSKRLGIVFQNVVKGAVRDCVVADNDRDGITVYFSSSEIDISGNHISGCSDDYVGLNAEDGTTTGNTLRQIAVVNNTMKGPGGLAKGKGVAVRGGSDILIAGNVIDSTSEEGIRLTDFNTTALGSVAVVDNVIRNSGQGGSSFHMAIFVLAGSSGTHTAGFASVSGVLVADNVIDGPVGEGIVLRSDHAAGELQHVDIRDNTIYNATDGIAVGGSNFAVTDVAVDGNRVRGASGNGIACLAASTASKRVFVNNNRVYNGAAMAIRLENVDSGSCLGNMAYDAQGSPTQTYGIRVRNATGTWLIGPNLAYGNVTANYDYTGSSAVMPAYTPSNVTTDRSYDANATTVDELADVLGTLLADLKGRGVVA
jgi:hypothetical protein